MLHKYGKCTQNFYFILFHFVLFCFSLVFYILRAFSIKQLFHSRSLDLRYPTRARVSIVN